MSNSASLASSSYPPVIPMDPQLRQLFEACRKGDFSLCIDLIDANPYILLSTTPYSNNCLHIAAMLGHHEFAREVWSRAPSLFSGINIDGETPLIAALMAANLLLASDIITAAKQYMQHDYLEEGRSFNHMLLKVDSRKENVLHYALRSGFQDFALQLLDIEPQLLEQVTLTGESPMYMAARRGYSRVVERILQIQSSANCLPKTESALSAAVRLDHAGYFEFVERFREIPSSVDSGPKDESVMHAAVKFDHPGIVKQLLEARSQLAYCKDKNGDTPLMRAILCNKIIMVKILLEYDPNLAYIKHEQTGNTPFLTAVVKGYVSIAEEIMNNCPDSVYPPDINGNSALNLAITFEKLDCVNYILKTPQLHRFVNQTNNNGNLPIHLGAGMCDPKLLCSLLAHKGQDYTAVNSFGLHAVDSVCARTDLYKTLKWNESFTLLSNVFPVGWELEVRDSIKQTNKKQAIKEVKLLTQNYTSNTSLVAALLATITFAAAFTLPGGFSTNPSDAGQPLFARKAAFQVFLISDTLAMCSSLAVAFLCILTTWEDLDFLLNYRKTTKALMWCAYGATTIAFGTGLFTVIAPNNLWLAILLLVLCTILPFLSKIIGEWPLLMLRYRLRGLFQKDLVPNI